MGLVGFAFDAASTIAYNAGYIIIVVFARQKYFAIATFTTVAFTLFSNFIFHWVSKIKTAP